MSDEKKECRELPRPSKLKNLQAFLCFQDTPYLGLLFAVALFCLNWLLYQTVVIYVPLGDFLSRVIAAAIAVFILWVFECFIFIPAVQSVVRPFAKAKWLQIILTIAGFVLFCPVGVALLSWSLYRQRKWLPFVLMSGVCLLSCLVLPQEILGIAWSPLSLPAILVGALAVTALCKQQQAGVVTRGRMIWAFLPLVLAGILWGFCLWQEHCLHCDSAAIRRRLAERLDYSMEVEDCRARLANGGSPLTEPYKTLLADNEGIDELFQSINGHEPQAELQAILKKVQENHGDYVKAAEMWKELPLQSIQHEVPENDYLYSLFMPELRGFRNAARYFSLKMRANAGDRQCVADCNQAMLAARNCLLGNYSIIIHTMVATAIEAIRVDALCYCLAYTEYSEDEWKSLLGSASDWNVLYARSVAEESIWHEDAMLWLLKTPKNASGFLKVVLGLPAFNARHPLRRWFGMDYHCGLLYTEKAVDLVLHDSREELSGLAQEFEKTIRQRGALISSMLLPDVSKGLLKCQLSRSRHSLALLAWQVVDYRRQHGGTLPNSMNDLPADCRKTLEKKSVIYEKGELELNETVEESTVKIHGFRLFLPNEEQKDTKGSNAKCSILVPIVQSASKNHP